ncbi:RNA polymerase subunit sigma-54 [Leucobacter sp. UCD-THU]|jgi:ribosomal subunit interface protein|uniref:Ribosome hibernation promoting factor n=1 Tax=Leucobacter muris TaxID=1935379 RepID=A0ABX5QHF6_9MICO|nr:MULTISPECIES: ribosome-associated translation inhibitor RaiA [Leucobacter]EYT55849.1 RNA polymerase subunit sigma-54 [Leucobacter sp. UCD-THU]QAB18460.1 ribosome-associated translation inhibitor RaiA [Leucobacter muris]
MDVNIRGKNVGITDRFENYVESKTEKVSGLLPRAQALEVKVSRQSDRSPKHGDLVEITLIGPGPVIRAESAGGDKYSAFDMAYGRVLERIRRMKDKRQDRRGRGRLSLGDAAARDFAEIDVTPAPAEVIDAVATGSIPLPDQQGGEDQYSPVVIRSKEFPAERLSVEDAVDQMELVGHDFFLFVESGTGRPSVVYRRRGWNYGVISLTEE